ncbi:hypothetical protein CCR75_008638 [Bremia lactucae]|uniref:Uncharacterized protein n=1 Tax=Bremia lactucae TaxID=4779 RepID=A0A976IDS1_BRELC|nr:hypothetical protein CCR75_008638 [Bremia lactucae]
MGKPKVESVDKLARYSSSTLRAEKVYKTIGYGLGAMGHLMAHVTQQETETSKGLQAIASNIAMARYVIRITGGFESYVAWKNNSWCYNDDSEHVKRIVSLQALSMMVYYPLDHISYIGAPMLLNIDALKLSRQSCQAWGIYILLDIYANTIRELSNRSQLICVSVSVHLNSLPFKHAVASYITCNFVTFSSLGHAYNGSRCLFTYFLAKI